MKAKRAFSLLLAIALPCCMAACSSGNTTPANGQSGTISLTAPEIGYNEQQVTTAKQNGKGTLSASDNFYIGVTNSIKKDHPNYKVNYVDWGWAEQLDSKQRAMLSSGNVPSIVAGETFMPDYANQGILAPLPKDIVDLVSPSFLIYDKEKRPVAVAYCSSTFMLFYNKDIIKKAGLDPDNPPKTWSDWQKDSEAITKAGNGKYWGGGIPSFASLGGALRASPFFRQMGVDFATKDGKSNLSDPKVQKVLQFIRTMNANLPKGVGNGADESPLWNAFQVNQTIAYAIDGAWDGVSDTANKMNWGVAPLPVADDAVDANANCLVGSVYVAVPKDAKNKDACFDLIRETLKQENEMWWVYMDRAVPLKSIINDDSTYKKDPVETTVMNQLKSGTYTGLCVWGKNGNQIWDIIDQNVLAKSTITNDPIEKICSDAQTQIEAQLK